MSGLSLPVGAVIAYAGVLTQNQLQSLGWSVCNGQELPVKDFQQLFAVIGTTYGGDGNQVFRLPDLQGYFLRGRDPHGQVDPDTATRSGASGSGGRIGSRQDWATAAPRNPFKATASHVPTTDHNAYPGSSQQMLVPGGFQVFSSAGGGDAETRPVNAGINHIIKLVPQAGMPAGCIVPYAGRDATGSAALAASYMLCDGTALEKNQHPALAKGIGTAHGGTIDRFNLPDYRGRFLRGTANGKPADPDAATRLAMAPGGAAGDAVGSVQRAATGRPQKPFTIGFNLGNDHLLSDWCLGHDDSQWNPQSTDVALTAAGGDSESRPVNVSVDFFVSAQDEQATDMFPIGGITGFAGNVAPPAGQWLLCNGATLQNGPQYAALFAAIKNANGGDAKSFRVPDLQGYFLRGRDRGSARDPDAAWRTAAGGAAAGDVVGSIQGWATGRPQTDITAPVPHLPTGLTANACAACSTTAAEWDDSLTVTVGGGDLETRPVNVCVDFYIKYAAAQPA